MNWDAFWADFSETVIWVHRYQQRCKLWTLFRKPTLAWGWILQRYFANYFAKKLRRYVFLEVIFDHNFLRFSPMFGEKIGVCLKKPNVMIKFLQNLPLFWVKNANFIADFFGENIFKIIRAVPGSDFWGVS
jgi:hypothetical protein